MKPLNRSSHPVLRLLLGSAVMLAGLGGLAATVVRGPTEDPRACCHAASPPVAWKKTTARHDVPAVEVVRADGARVDLRREIDDGRPVILNFIFTTCTAICPVMSQTFAQIQSRLGDERYDVHLVSVSIDPEEDTPARLAAYAQRFHAGPQWTFYGGTAEASVAAQRAFDVYRGDKMNHAPVTLLRAAPGEPWVQLEGFARAEEVVEEYRRLVAAHRGVSP
jgi:protein SCO1/2